MAEFKPDDQQSFPDSFKCAELETFSLLSVSDEDEIDSISQECEFKPNDYPPFPDGLKCAQLETFSLSKLSDKDEIDRLCQACKTRGFFYLSFQDTNLSDLPEQSKTLAKIGEQGFKLSQEEKDKFLWSPTVLFGYKKVGATVVDKDGTPDTNEFFNVSKDDMLSPEQSIPLPELLLDERISFAKYMIQCHGLGMSILEKLGSRLGTEARAFENLHNISKPSGDHVRLTRGPPRKNDLPEIQTPSHTDFGTVTILFNWLGGLQVWSESSRGGEANVIEQSSGEWLWVKPKPEHAIINLGDAAVEFTGGILCSGRHRVVPAPGAQGLYPRYSVVYFVRPQDDIVLQRLQGREISVLENGHHDNLTAKEWIKQQARSLGIGREADKL